MSSSANCGQGGDSGSNERVGTPGSATIAGKSRQASASGSGRLGSASRPRNSGRPSSTAAWRTRASALEM